MRHEAILKAIQEAYATNSLDFVKQQYLELLQHQCVTKLMRRHLVKNETDLNAHVSLHLSVMCRDSNIMLCLSCVRPYAMMFRMPPGTLKYIEVIAGIEAAAGEEERDIVELVQRSGFVLVNKEDAVRPVDVKLCDAEPGETRVYHALISDEVFTPEVLQ